MAGASDITGAPQQCGGYPLTFSAELVHHCEAGCVPPSVFADARAVLDAAHRHRYVRVNSRCEARVMEAGAQAALRLQALSHTSPGSRSGDSPPLTEEEVAALSVLPRTEAVSSHSGAASNSGDVPASCTESPRARLCRAAPRATLLRLGLAALTGLPLAAVRAVPWLPCGVFSLPWSYAMGGNALFTDGTLLAMDAASIAAVVALRPRRGERVLDLCCAPGMKLGLLAEAVADTTASRASSHSTGLAVGVDVSLSRLYMTRSTLRKQQGTGIVAPPLTSSLPVCIFAGDGARFRMPRDTTSNALDAVIDLADTKVDAVTGLTAAEKRRLQRRHGSTPNKAGAKRHRDVAAAVATAATSGQQQLDEDSGTREDDGVSVVYAPVLARASIATWLEEAQRCEAGRGAAVRCPTPEAVPLALPSPLRFDRVLVDAECSHDGSVAHMQLDDDDEDARAQHAAAAPAIEKGRGVHNAYRMQHLNLGLAASQGATTSRSPQPSGAEEAPSAAPAAAGLFALQSALLDNGYRQLRSGGTLVYATCSYSYRQNEDVVAAFLERAGGLDADATAVLVPAFSYEHEPASSGGDGDVGGHAEKGLDQCTSVAACVRFDSEAQGRALQAQLDAHALDYGVVQQGHARYRAGASAATASVMPVGSRFWPRTFRSSFLYVAKIWKKPKHASAGRTN